MIDSVLGVIIWTKDLDTLLSFYRDTLEITPHSVHAEFVSFKWGEMRLGIGKHSEVEGRTTEPFRVMVNFSVSDIHHVYAELRARDVEFIRPPEKEHWGGWVATFSDPDGNILQLLQLR